MKVTEDGLLVVVGVVMIIGSYLYGKSLYRKGQLDMKKTICADLDDLIADCRKIVDKNVEEVYIN